MAHDPVGERCAHCATEADDYYRNRWDFDPDCRSEMNRLHENKLDPKLSPAEHVRYSALLRILMKRAVTGTIDFDAGEGSVIRDTIVELRPRLRQTMMAFGRRPRLLRLYLAEPAIVPRLLVGLHLATKAASEAGLDEQDVSIEVALDRAYSWTPAS